MNQQQNQINLNLHPQRLISLAIAAVTLIFMFLTWWKAEGNGSKTGNGFGDFGLLTAAGILGVIIACFMGNKTMPFEKQTKMIAMGSFAAIAVGAILHAIITPGQGGKTQVTDGFNIYEIDVKATIGIGTWLALATGLIGLAYVSGILNQISAGAARPASAAPVSHPPTPPSAPPPPPPPPSN